jgi:hypothetical protein
MRAMPVYVLTSSRTFSAAEEFTCNLRNLERPTIVGGDHRRRAHPFRIREEARALRTTPLLAEVAMMV